VLIHWSSPNDIATWKFRLVRPGFFNAEITYATAENTLGAVLEIQIGEQVKHCDLPSSGGGPDQFLSQTFTIAVTSSGENKLSARLLKPVGGDPLVLKGIRLIPVGGSSGL